MAEADEKKRRNPSTTSAAYDSMSSGWSMLDTIMAGTEAMRAAGEGFLPKHERERATAYSNRLSQAVLFNAVEKTVNDMTGKVFSSPIMLGEDIPSNVAELMEDVDLRGNDLTRFSQGWFRDGIVHGLSHVLVDMPPLPVLPEGVVRTLADDRDEKRRPHWCHITATSLLFSAATFVGGKEVLTHIRIAETDARLDGFMEVFIPRIRCIWQDHWSLWEPKAGEKDEWVVVEEGENELGVIPLVTLYCAAREGLHRVKPPLLDLGYLNIAHWQSSSDQQNILTVTRFPILAASGLPESDEGPGVSLEIGPNKWLSTQDPQGKFYYVEHTGAAIGAGQVSITELEKQMESYGAQLLTRKPGNPTATGEALDTAKATSPLEDMAGALADAIGQCLYFTRLWMEPTGDFTDAGTVTVNDDGLGLDILPQGDLDALNKARASGDISRVTYLGELQRRGVLSADFDAEADLEELDNDAERSLGRMEEEQERLTPPEDPIEEEE